MSETKTNEWAGALAAVHGALDEAELERACGDLVEALAGPVPWRLILPGEGERCLGGVGARTGRDGAPEPRGGATAVLRFRGDPVGEFGIGVPVDADELEIVGDHLAAALVKLSLWNEAEEEARRRLIDREVLRSMSAVVGGFDVEYVLARAVEQVMKVVGSDVGSVLQWDGNRFVTSVSLGLPEEVTGAIVLEGRPVGELVAEVGEPLLLKNPDVSHLPPAAAGIDLECLLFLPLVSRTRVVGVMQVANPAVESHDSPKLEAAGEICQLAATAVENALLHREVVQRERLATIGQVMAGLSHDIKNMLQSMRGARFLLEQGVQRDDMEAVRRAYPLFSSAMDRISSFTLDMLDYSKSRKPTREPQDLNVLVTEITTAMQPAAAAKGFESRLVLDESMEPVPVDSTGIYRCLSNLITNAVEAVDNGGDVEIRTEWAPGEPSVRITVSDDGPGVKPEHREHVFDALYTTKGSKGTGLGLAVTKKIIEEHGGEIALGTAEGRGAVFTIRLPKRP
ncbi:MAG: ATP-binding protein [Candidatus Eisenbacteria bacterium]